MKKILGLIALSLLCNLNVNAQLLKRLKNKAQEAVERTAERKVEEKAEQTAEKALDTLFDSPKKIKTKKGSETDSTNMPDIMESMGNAVYETKYIFPITATIEVEDLNANLKKTTMKQGYGKETLINEMETDGDPFIIDMKNQSAVLLNINQGTAQVMSLKWMEQMMGNAPENEDEAKDKIPTVIKTGRTKVMNGYTCYEYNITFEGGKINAWYAPDVTFDYQDYLRGMSKLFSKKKEDNPLQLLSTDYGYIMEMTLYNSENKKQTSMKVINLSENVRMINMDLFKIQKL